MNEFSTKIGSPGKGIISAVLAAVKYLLVPILVLGALTALLAQVEGASIITDQIDLERVRFFVIALGIPMTALAFFRGFYPRGTRSRCLFGVTVSALACMWIWIVMMGGSLSLELEEVGFSLSYVGIVLLFILAAALGGLYYVVEMISYRQEWLAASGPLAGPVFNGAQ